MFWTYRTSWSWRKKLNRFDASVALWATPWGYTLVIPSPLINTKMAESISTTRQRLSESHKNNRHQICSSLSFGFWSGLLGKDHDELWKKCLHKAFPYAYEGRRKSVSIELEAVRKFRNRIAHHNSLLRTDILFEVARIFKLAGYIDPDFERWIKSVSRVNDVYKEKPTQEIDTVVVAAKEAWPLYQEASIYVCQPGRSFRDTKYIAFYHDRKIEPEFARIKAKFDDVIWTEENAEKLSKSSDRIEKKIGHAIRESRLRGWTGGRYQIFILSSPGEKYPHGAHRSRETPIPHQHNGRGSAFTMGQMYTSIHKLETADTTDDL